MRLLASPNPKIAAIELSIQLGEYIKQYFPEIRNLYMRGYSVQKIVDAKRAKIHRHNRLRDINLDTIVNAFLYALKGYDGHLSSARFRLRRYRGLLNPREFKKYRDEHLAQGRRYRVVNVLHYTAISPKERKRIIQLANQEKYHIDNRNCTNNTKIAEKINDEIHEGHPIRTNTAINAFLCKYRKKMAA